MSFRLEKLYPQERTPTPFHLHPPLQTSVKDILGNFYDTYTLRVVPGQVLPRFTRTMFKNPSVNLFRRKTYLEV